MSKGPHMNLLFRRGGGFGETALPRASTGRDGSPKRPPPSASRGRDVSPKRPPTNASHGRDGSPKRPAHCASTGGFSLIEALVALVIFAGVAVIFSQAFFNTLTALDTQKAEVSKIDDLRFVRSQVILEPDLETFEEGGEIQTLDAGEARWEGEVEETEIPHLFKVHLQIEFSGTQEVEGWTHEEDLYLLRPTWSDATESSELMADVTDRITDKRDTWDW